jgi:hypothetical protein
MDKTLIRYERFYLRLFTYGIRDASVRFIQRRYVYGLTAAGIMLRFMDDRHPIGKLYNLTLGVGDENRIFSKCTKN